MYLPKGYLLFCIRIIESIPISHERGGWRFIIDVEFIHKSNHLCLSSVVTVENLFSRWEERGREWQVRGYSWMQLRLHIETWRIENPHWDGRFFFRFRWPIDRLKATCNFIIWDFNFWRFPIPDQPWPTPLTSATFLNVYRTHTWCPYLDNYDRIFPMGSTAKRSLPSIPNRKPNLNLLSQLQACRDKLLYFLGQT